jgi:ComF family protein
MNWGRFYRRVYAFLIAILDAILPPHARTMRTNLRDFDDIPLTIAVHHLLGGTITTLMDYKAREVRDLVQSLKYDGNTHAALLCASVLADFLREEIANIRNFSPRPICIIPLPLHFTRERERGFNQIARVLEQLPQEFQDGTLSRVESNILSRTRSTERQTTLARAKRIRNMDDAFAIDNPDTVLYGTHIFIIDDVTTTGATLVNAAKPFSDLNVSVTLLALARA